MSDNQRRWLCKECKREWIQPTYCYANSSQLTITGNPINGDNCPICGSPYIELIEFKPLYPGLDIPRDDINKVIPMQTINHINRDFSIRAETPAVLIPFHQVSPEQTQKEIEEVTLNWTQLI